MTIFFPEAANKRVILAHVQPVNADLNDVFPLLCPVRRYEWDADWNCELVHTDSGVAEELCVFRVESGSNQGTWCVTRYQQGQSISLFRVNADFITEVNISAYANPNGGSTIHWEVTSTGHSDAGDAAITAATDEAFIAEVQQLTQQLEQRANGDALGYAPSRNDDGSFAPQSKYTRVNAKATAHASPPPEAIHPMFSPVREYEWEPKWLCKYHYNMTRDMEQSEIHWVDDPDFADYGIWMTVRYDRPHRLTHMRINDDRVTVYDWTYDRAANGGTDMGWNITDTGLNEAIIPHIDIMTDEHLQKVWEKVARQFEYFICTGEPLEIPTSEYVGMPIYDEETGGIMTFEKLKAKYIEKLVAQGIDIEEVFGKQ